MTPAPAVRLLTVCGSLGARSANRAALDVIAAAAAATGAAVDDFESLAELPAFDPDRSDEPIAVVTDWRRAVKNAFDWIVGSGELYRKPVGVVVVAEAGIGAPRTKSDAAGRLVDAPTWPDDELVATVERVLGRFGIDPGHIAPPAARPGVARVEDRP